MNQYLTSFSINNFRVFADETTFDFAPITILTGTNSSGKSSLTRALMLLAKSYQLSGLRKLNFFESDLKIGGFSAIKNHQYESDLVTFELSLAPANVRIKLFYRTEDLAAFQIFVDDELHFAHLLPKQLECGVKHFLKLPANIIYREKLYKLFVTASNDEFEIVFQKILDYLQGANYSPEHSFPNRSMDIFELIYDERILGIRELENNTYSNYEGETIINHKSPLLLQIIPEETIKFGLEDIRLSDYLDLDVLKSLNFPFADILLNFFNQFVFIPGVRAKQEVLITPNNSPLLYSQIQRYHDSEDVKNHANHAITKWLVNEFNIIEIPKDDNLLKRMFQIIPVEDLGYLFQLTVNDKWINLSSLGYGVSQLLPIILSVVLNTEPKTYIIEEPESNLHPALQSKLADFFFEASTMKNLSNSISLSEPEEKIDGFTMLNRFIIETHSEYIIRKLQYLTASPKSELKPQDTVIYYFYNPKAIPPGLDQIQKIEILKNGGLSHDFGSGFFDEAINWKFELLKLKNSQNN